jgi:hypothetical protein
VKGIKRVRRRIAQAIARSSVPEDPTHSTNTLKWLLRLDPRADAALQIAALGHDIERADDVRRVRREDFLTFDAFKAVHARNSARILMEIMQECGVQDEPFRREVCRLVRLHEIGGDPRSDLLVDADGISYFDVNLPFYLERNTWEETRRRCVWGYRRLSERAKLIVADLSHPSGEISRVMTECIEATTTFP